MRIAHFSDTHGLPRKPVPDDCDLVVISGDVAPNRTRGVGVVEGVYQENWYRKTMLQWKAWIRGKRLLVIQGNHDFFDPTSAMRSSGIAALSCNWTTVEIEGVRFSGLPDIPLMGNEWNHEFSERTIAHHLEALLRDEPDVVVGHCPPHGVLDMVNGYNIGSKAVAELLEHASRRLKAYLCGHCHEHGGKAARIRGMLVSNAATSRRIVTI